MSRPRRRWRRRCVGAGSTRSRRRGCWRPAHDARGAPVGERLEHRGVAGRRHLRWTPGPRPQHALEVGDEVVGGAEEGVQLGADDEAPVADRHEVAEERDPHGRCHRRVDGALPLDRLDRPPVVGGRSLGEVAATTPNQSPRVGCTQRRTGCSGKAAGGGPSRSLGGSVEAVWGVQASSAPVPPSSSTKKKSHRRVGCAASGDAGGSQLSARKTVTPTGSRVRTDDERRLMRRRPTGGPGPIGRVDASSSGWQSAR
jgi:hypothetical protein